ncbi:MAG: DUF4129 domain-containing protein [Pyrinomonadaceae bacterium]
MTIRFGKTIFLVIGAVVFAGQTFAATVDDYQRRLDSAVGVARGLIEVVENEDRDIEAEEVETLRHLIPRKETIETSGGSVEADNRWLAAAIDEFVAEADLTKREGMIIAIGDRLSAVAASVRELKSASETGPSKDEDKQKLAEILRRTEYQKPEPQQESIFQKWWRQFTEWLRRAFPQPEVTPSAPSGFGSMKLGLQILVFAIVIGLVGFLLWRFLPLVSARFRAREKRDDGDRVILGERLGADASSADIFSEAESLARLGDHRGAIRKGYIAVLCELGDQNIVRLARHKTNRDYLRDVRKREDLFTDMLGLTGNFERSWYGLRLSHADDWEDFRDNCRKAISLVKGS